MWEGRETLGRIFEKDGRHWEDVKDIEVQTEGYLRKTRDTRKDIWEGRETLGRGWFRKTGETLGRIIQNSEID